jgi:Flp pilus assembly protein TadD
MQTVSRSTSAFRMLGMAGLVLLTLGGCMRSASRDVTGSVGAPSSDPGSLRVEAEALGKRYSEKPGDRDISLRYALVLRQQGQFSQAVAVLQQAAIANARDREVQAAYGKLLMETGRLNEAAKVLANAHSPDRPDWRILSAQGAVADQLGDHGQAQRFYQSALTIAPDEPSILSNLGLSYALTQRLPEAEQILRKAVASPRADRRVRANLALVVALQGRFDQAREIAMTDSSPEEAEASIAYIRNMMSQPNRWKDIRQAEGRNG